jgi:hypothetical protein
VITATPNPTVGRRRASSLPSHPGFTILLEKWSYRWSGVIVEL